MIALDLLLPSSDGGGFIHRIFGVYAPWNPGGDGLTAQFWPKLSQLCNTTPHSWTLIGDLNTTVSPAEQSGSENRTPYTNFLQSTGGKDIWKQYPLRNRLVDWTCKAKDTHDGGAIIDQLVTSATGIMEAQLQVATKPNDYIPVTDHRPIVVYIIPCPPNGSLLGSLPNAVLPTPRIRYPTAHEKHLLQIYEWKTEEQAANMGLFEHQVTDNETFLWLYMQLTSIINKTAEECFGHKAVGWKKPVQDVMSPRIQALKSESRHIGGLLLTLKPNNTCRISESTVQYGNRIQRIHE